MKIIFKRKENVCGGTRDNTNRLAPKKIKSNELVAFDTEFYRCADEKYNSERIYRFKLIKNENGTYVISEGFDNEFKCEVEASFAAELQQIIRQYELIRFNGINKQTYGLPPECSPYWVEALYASKEKLSFLMNGNPYAEWTKAILWLFAEEFKKQGIVFTS